MEYVRLDDATLIRLIARADADALSALYDRYSRLMFSLAPHTVGEPGGAEEITLDVFTRVWKKARTYADAQGAGVTGTLGVIERTDGGRQVTYNGIPLYFWIKDMRPGDATGHGVNDVWFVAPP